MGIWKSLAGQVEVALTGAEPEKSLDAVAGLGVEMTGLERLGDLTYRFRIARRDYKKVAALCRKRGETLEIRRRVGLYWLGKGLIRRPVLVAGMGLLLGLTLFLPGRVLFIEVEGNERVPARLILEAAEESGVRFGASRRALRSEKVKNALLAAVPQLQWAGVNTAGCTATISVRERSEPEPVEALEFGNIVASRDGFLLSTTVTRGTALCAPGQTVKAGQTLISGYTDCGICIRATGAAGEVYAQTHRSLTAVTPLVWQEKGAEEPAKRKISVTLGKKRIIFWKDSGILEGSCGRMVSEYNLTLPGGFSLPVTLWVETYTPCVSVPVEVPEMGEGLSAFAVRYLQSRMVAGAVLDRRETVMAEDGLLRLTGEYVCTEMIGMVQREQIGDTHGKSD